MSTTPTANISSKSSPKPQIPSRHLEHDFQVPHSQSATAALPQAPPPSHLTEHLTSFHNSAQGPSHHSRPKQDVSTSRPTKRQRTSRLADMAAERASSSSDSSQSGMADNETEAERSQQSERSAPQVTAPPKKKRTRTLTTPHQSAVLHALLAKSRFPTTAMREEVGRQIGLSARKVQIWFQNQRQKARRPQGEPAPLTRPPQFGPFPIMTHAGPSSHPSPSAGAAASELSPSGPNSAPSAMHESKGSADSNPPLSGPGIPGWPFSSHQCGPSAEEWELAQRAPTIPELSLGSSQHPLPPRLFEGISTRDSRGSTRDPAPQPAQATHVEASPHFSRLLPPINLSALEPRSSTEPYVSATPSFPPQPPSTSLNFVPRHDSPAHPAIEPSSPVHLSIPPPFALQPQPQWDPRIFAPYTRPEFASWSQTSGSSLSSARAGFSAGGAHDHVTRNISPDSSRGRHFFPFSGEPYRGTQLDPLPHHIISPSRGQRLSTSASSLRASVSGEGHARSNDEAGEE